MMTEGELGNAQSRYERLEGGIYRVLLCLCRFWVTAMMNETLTYPVVASDPVDTVPRM